ncbi:hypothetical protein N9Y89_01715 [bacterium]|nr:hypothetical protein [bacterium]
MDKLTLPTFDLSDNVRQGGNGQAPPKRPILPPLAYGSIRSITLIPGFKRKKDNKKTVINRKANNMLLVDLKEVDKRLLVLQGPVNIYNK